MRKYCDEFLILQESYFTFNEDLQMFVEKTYYTTYLTSHEKEKAPVTSIFIDCPSYYPGCSD